MAVTTGELGGTPELRASLSNSGSLYGRLTGLGAIDVYTKAEILAIFAQTTSQYTGASPTLASNAVTQLTSVVLAKGSYLLIGTASFNQNGIGDRLLRFSTIDNTDSGASPTGIDRFATIRVRAAGTGATKMQLTSHINVTADTGTTVYLYGSQDSGENLVADQIGIKVIKLR